MTVNPICHDATPNIPWCHTHMPYIPTHHHITPPNTHGPLLTYRIIPPHTMTLYLHIQWHHIPTYDDIIPPHTMMTLPTYHDIFSINLLHPQSDKQVEDVHQRTGTDGILWRTRAAKIKFAWIKASETCQGKSTIWYFWWNLRLLCILRIRKLHANLKIAQFWQTQVVIWVSIIHKSKVYLRSSCISVITINVGQVLKSPTTLFC